jgi:ribonuclease HI
MSIKVYTDGCCLGNNQLDQSKRVMGIGIYFPGGELGSISEKVSPTDGKCTNNYAELFAIYRAIEYIRTYIPNTEIQIHTDSQYAIGVLSGTMKSHDVQNSMLISRISKIMVSYIKVKGHSGCKDGNYYADKLAKGMTI